ncbi:tetratricopeptide repeat protein [Helicobacter sp. L8]|uniref:tetratricopeptide repeat protein n=1 Tax=Helicobacter sp. L8 TaxID=2316078 RepID=UPI0013CDFC39|nr:tetratricopeptide repeat protein [Helicobacter sp. L8]
MLRKYLIMLFLAVGVLGAQDNTLQQAEAAYKRKDYPTAFKLYKQEAQRGEAQAIYHLGLMYRYGELVDLDYKQAAKYFERAGKMGVADAYLELAEMVADGKIVKNAKGEPFACERALLYANRALELSPKRADIYRIVGKLYISTQAGESLCSFRYEEKIFQKGLSYLEKAGEMGDFSAYTLLGYNYFWGSSRFERSFKKAKQYYLKAVAVLEKAGAKGDSQAYNELGLIYQGEYGNFLTRTILGDLGCCKATRENGDKAMEYFKKAVAMGNAHAYTNMGKYVDENKAKEYYKKAGELGDAQGYVELAQMEGALLSKSIG